MTEPMTEERLRELRMYSSWSPSDCDNVLDEIDRLKDKVRDWRMVALCATQGAAMMEAKLEEGSQ